MVENRNSDRNPIRGCNYGLEGGCIFDFRGVQFSIEGGALVLYVATLPDDHIRSKHIYSCWRV